MATSLDGQAIDGAATKPPTSNRGGGTWWRYVETVTAGAAQKDVAAATGIDQSSISRWQRGTNTPRAEAVVALARAYGRSPVEALVAAGYLSPGDRGVVEPTTPALPEPRYENGVEPKSEAAR